MLSSFLYQICSLQLVCAYQVPASTFLLLLFCHQELIRLTQFQQILKWKKNINEWIQALNMKWRLSPDIWRFSDAFRSLFDPNILHLKIPIFASSLCINTIVKCKHVLPGIWHQQLLWETTDIKSFFISLHIIFRLRSWE